MQRVSKGGVWFDTDYGVLLTIEEVEFPVRCLLFSNKKNL